MSAIGGGGAVILALSSWLGKVWASRILEHERAALQRLTDEHRVRFAKLHDKQALLIGELYEKLYEVDYGVRQVDYWISQTLLKPRKDWIAQPCIQLSDHLLDLRRHFEKHQIYFSELLCDRLRSIISSSSEVSDEFFVSLITIDDDKLEEACKTASQIVKSKKALVDQGLEAIRDDFRKLLGVV